MTQWLAAVGRDLIEFWHSIEHLFDTPIFKIGAAPITLMGIIEALLLFLIALLVSYIMQNMIARIGTKHMRLAASSYYHLGRLAHYIIVIVGLVIALSSLGLDFSKVAMLASALGIGIGFGMQSIANNFVSGIILLCERSIKHGDLLQLESGDMGYVTEINVRSTVIRTLDGKDIIVPNSVIIGNKLINWTMGDNYRRMHVPFSVAYGTDKTLVKKAALEAANKVPHTLHAEGKEPTVWLVKMADSSLDFELIVWVDAIASRNMANAMAAYMWELHSALEQNKIDIPYPQLDVHLRQP